MEGSNQLLTKLSKWSILMCLLLCLCGLCVQGGYFKKFPLLMPHVRPEFKETYLCTSIRIDPTEDYYVTAFEPNASMATAHHMLLYGCSEPGSKDEVYNCGGMAIKQPGLGSAPVCRTGSQVIYAWAKNAPKLVLPEEVAFKIGGKTDVQYLVLQVHYASVEAFKDGGTDDSGVLIYYTKMRQPKTAGVLMLGTGGRILPNSIEYMETACTIKESKVIHPFAYRTHTHGLGRVVSGYKVSNNNHDNKWTLIGKKDPQLPQMFYPVENKMTISKGDTVAARCTMESTRDHITRVGQTQQDEMCNYYIMYWTNGPALDQKTCFSIGPPIYYWAQTYPALKNIPNEDASSLPVGESAKEQGYDEAAFR